MLTGVKQEGGGSVKDGGGKCRGVHSVHYSQTAVVELSVEVHYS